MHPDPKTRPALLWTILYLGCLMSGLVLAALIMPVQESVAPLARVGFGTLLVLSVVLLGLAAWQLTTVLSVPRAAWRWVVLLAAVAAVVALALWSATSRSPDDSVFVGLGTTALSALGFTAAVAVGMHALVKILASGSPGSQAPRGR